ncbi:hypothetical protein BGY98DRAFT_1088919 [Russula aff. rugulosa BPL654]|nr:hypothetical protein BGY98DRAFT_1088919 [Russula aff. rugulosa BPL654]
MSTSASPPFASLPSPERTAELYTALSEIRARISVASASNSPLQRLPTLVAVSKFKPAEDLRACYDAGQRDFGENYAQQLVEKALRYHATCDGILSVQYSPTRRKYLQVLYLPPSLPFPPFIIIDAGWRLGIENLYAVQTVASTRSADALNRYRAVEHGPLRVFIQLNTSGEQTKGGIDIAPISSPTAASASAADGATERGMGEDAGEGGAGGAEEKLTQLATHIIRSCPRLRLVGLMTIGKPDGGEEDFVALREARDRLSGWRGGGRGEKTHMRMRGRRLLLSMGMSHDFEMALRAGADVVRVGTGIFGARPPKKGLEVQ